MITGLGRAPSDWRTPMGDALVFPCYLPRRRAILWFRKGSKSKEVAMPCLVAGVALMVPRLAMFFIWLFTGWFRAAFHTWYWPLLGFFFMPYTTLAYMAAMLNNNHAVSGLWLALIIIAAIVDAGHWGGGRRTWKRRRIVIMND